MGGTHSLMCNKLAKDIWIWCHSNIIWQSATHIPGITNVEADSASRKFKDSSEWKLDPSVFERITEHWGKPNLDLFASYINFQFKPYISWKPDPDAQTVNAFTFSWHDAFMYIFPPFPSYHGTSTEENQGGQRQSHSYSSIMADSTMVASPVSADVRTALTVAEPQELANSTIQPRNNPPPLAKTAFDSMSIIRNCLQLQGISARAQEIILASWRSGTKKQYKVYLNSWISFCKRKNFSPLAPKLSQVLEFLTTLFDSGLGYSGMNTARSALSAVAEIKDSNHTVASYPLVQRFLKAVFQSRPSLPKYSHTWDVTIVLDYLKTIAPKEKLTLKQLTQKLAMLCLLVTGNRCQSLALMDINTMFKEKSSYKFPINELVKQCRPGKEQPVLVLPAYPVDRRLCVYTYLTEYLVSQTTSERVVNCL